MKVKSAETSATRILMPQLKSSADVDRQGADVAIARRQPTGVSRHDKGNSAKTEFSFLRRYDFLTGCRPINRAGCLSRPPIQAGRCVAGHHQ